MSQIVRISHDGRSVVVKTTDSRYATLTSGSSDIAFFSSLSEARGSKRWRLPTKDEKQSRPAAVELVEAAAVELSVAETPTSERRRVYRVPKAVRTEAKRGLRWMKKEGYEGPETEIARHLSNAESVDIKTVQELRHLRETLYDGTERELGFKPGDDGYPNKQRIQHALLGGDPAISWSNRVSRSHRVTIVAGAFTYEDDCTYFAGGDNPDSTEVDALYMLRPDETWAVRELDEWQDAEEPDRAQLIELDEESASALAEWLDSEESADALFELQNVNPIERNLFELAASQLDWEELDRATEAAFLAGLASPDGYTPQERSQNAQRQQRSTDGKFGGGAAAPAEAKQQMTAFARARLPMALPLVTDVAGLITAYLAEVERQRAGAEPKHAAEFAVETVSVDPAQSDVRPLYVAVVDEVDTEAVLDVIALVPPAAGQQGDVTAWRRQQAQWTSAPEVLADLRGATPPPVVELADDELVRNVLSQVDQTDSGDQQPQQDVEQHEMQEPVQASAADFGLWGQYGEIVPIFGPRGDILATSFVAAGIPGVADTPSDHAAVARLKRYWTVGEGGMKIRWNTPGDMTRCMRHLKKYLKGREAGFCANLHKQMTGTWPGDKDNIGKRG